MLVLQHFATLGSSFISCDDTSETVTSPPNNNNNQSGEGYTVDGNVYTIDLTNSSFSNLQSSGGWKRFDEGGMLIVNVGQGVIRAFSNSCPHQVVEQVGDTPIRILSVVVTMLSSVIQVILLLDQTVQVIFHHTRLF